MFLKMLILVSENGEVACMDTTLHRLQRPFFLVSQFPGFLVFLCFTLLMFGFYFPLHFFITHFAGDFCCQSCSNFWVNLSSTWQGGLAPLAFKRQAFPWRDAGPRLLRRRSEGKGEAGWDIGGKSRKFTEFEMIYETIHDQMIVMMMMMMVMMVVMVTIIDYILAFLYHHQSSLSLYHLPLIQQFCQ